MKKGIIGVLVAALATAFALPVDAAPDAISVVSDTTVKIVGIYNKAPAGGYVDLSGSPLGAVRAQEPKPYPTGYSSEPPEVTNSIWDTNTGNYFAATGADWIWETERAEWAANYPALDPLYDADASTHGRVVVFEQTFSIPGIPQSGILHITADNCYEVWVNGAFLVRSATAKVAGWESSDLYESKVATTGWQTVGHHAITAAMLNPGVNTIRILAGNEYYNNDDGNSPVPPYRTNPYRQQNPGALIFKMDIEYEKEINLDIDVKPTSCPNPLNFKNKGALPVAILGTESFDVTNINPETILLEGVAPLRWSYEDVASTFEGELSDCSSCTTKGADGFMDLTLKFDQQEVVASLGDVRDGECLVVTLTGKLNNGTAFSGSDIFKIINKVKNGEQSVTTQGVEKRNGKTKNK